MPGLLRFAFLLFPGFGGFLLGAGSEVYEPGAGYQSCGHKPEPEIRTFGTREWVPGTRELDGSYLSWSLGSLAKTYFFDNGKRAEAAKRGPLPGALGMRLSAG